MTEKIYARIREMRYSHPLNEMATTLSTEFHITYSAAEQMILLCAFADSMKTAMGI